MHVFLHQYSEAPALLADACFLHHHLRSAALARDLPVDAATSSARTLLQNDVVDIAVRNNPVGQGYCWTCFRLQKPGPFDVNAEAQNLINDLKTLSPLTLWAAQPVDRAVLFVPGRNLYNPAGPSW